MNVIQEGMTVFYVDESRVFSGQVFDLEEVAGGDYEFGISSYGTCEGPYRISSRQLGRTVFFSEEEARKYC